MVHRLEDLTQTLLHRFFQFTIRKLSTISLPKHCYCVIAPPSPKQRREYKNYLSAFDISSKIKNSQSNSGGAGGRHPSYSYNGLSLKICIFFFNREKLRHERILSSLAGNITTSHTIYPSFGRVEFFEFVLRNPYSTDQTVTIYCDDNELKYVNKRLVFNSYSLSQWIYTCVSLCKQHILMICYLHVDCSQARYTKGKPSYSTGKSSRFAHHKSKRTDPTGFRFSCCFWGSVIPPSPYISSTATYVAGCFVRAQFFSSSEK